MTFNSIANKDKEPFHHCMERLFACINYYKNAYKPRLNSFLNKLFRKVLTENLFCLTLRNN